VLVVKEGHTITHTPDTMAFGRLRAPYTEPFLKWWRSTIYR